MKKVSLSLTLCTLLLLIACSKSKDPEPTPIIDPIVATPPITYVAGFVDNGTAKVATLWKNGVKSDLSAGVKPAQAKSVFVAGTDVFVAGFEDNNSNKSIAKLWRNGTAIDLTDGTKYAYAYSVFVAGSDVYVVGSESVSNIDPNKRIAKLWKNGVATNLTNGTFNADASAVFVSGADVFVAFNERNATGTYDAKTWKNGVVSSLASGVYNSSANSLFISSGNVYVCGSETATVSSGAIGKIWKDGTAMPITNNGEFFSSIYVNGINIYANGHRSANATTTTLAVWKNGIAGNITDGTYNAVLNGANSLFVTSNGDVYVAGNRDVGMPVVTSVAPVLWKNGVQTLLPTNGSTYAVASAVFVK